MNRVPRCFKAHIKRTRCEPDYTGKKQYFSSGTQHAANCRGAFEKYTFREGFRLRLLHVRRSLELASRTSAPFAIDVTDNDRYGGMKSGGKL